MSLLLKDDVLVSRVFDEGRRGVQPEILIAISIVQGAYERVGVKDCMITSLLDGTHMVGSLHYKGYAADFRTKGTGLAKRLFDEVRKALPPNQYDVLLENLDQPNEHIHVEFDPK